MKINQELIEKNVGWLIVLVVLVVSVGGLAEIVPLYFQKSTTERTMVAMLVMPRLPTPMATVEPGFRRE